MTVIVGTENRDTIYANEPGVVVYGLSGGDYIFNSSEGTLLIGGDGNDHYRLYNSSTQVIEEMEGGYDVIWAYDHIVMPDNIEEVIFKRSSNWYTIVGNEIDNVITSGDGDQAISGSKGNDTLTGGGGNDQFSFASGDGHDVITDFSPYEDKLTFWSMGIDELSSLEEISTQTNDGLLISFSATQSLLLENVQFEDFFSATPIIEAFKRDILLGAQVVFEDNFDSEESLRNGNWTTTPANGHPVTSSISRGNRFQRYVDLNSVTENGKSINVNPFSISEGILSITAVRTPDHLKEEIAETWLSGSLETHGTFEQTYGYFEVRAKTPAGQGLWPAFWLVPSDYTWPPESDILEALGSLPNVYRAATHGALWGDKVTIADSWLVPDTSEEFHTYGVLWTPQTLTYTFDGMIMLRTPTPANMHTPHSLHLNLALGGWDGDPDDTTPDGASFEVDYVKVWDIPSLSDESPNSDMSAFGDLDNGILYTSEFGVLDLYGGSILTASEASPNLVLGNSSIDASVGTDGDNVLFGNGEGTTFNALAGDDVIEAQSGSDYLIGGLGNDTLIGGEGADTLVGGEGNDTYVFSRSDGATDSNIELVIEASNEGFDQIIFLDVVPSDVRSYIDWARWHIVIEGAERDYHFSVKITPGIGGHDIGSHIEQVVFSDGTVWDLTGSLYLRGDDRDNVNSGSVHDDTIFGEDGSDTLVGMDGNDVIDGGPGDDFSYGWNGDDYVFDSGIDGSDQLFGEAGNDTLIGGSGLDYLYGGPDRDVLRSSKDGDVLYGQAGDDTLTGGGGADTLIGGDGSDILKGNGNRDLLGGEEGDDRIIGGGGDDTIEGGLGNDVLNGGTRNDIISGGEGNDKLNGQNGDDTLMGGLGRDVLTGGPGADVFVFDLGILDELDRILDFNQEEGDQIKVTGIDGVSDPTFHFVSKGDYFLFSADVYGEKVDVARISSAYLIEEGDAVLF
ncbi:family 16 glycosylhydrolase [Donghicola mangrovi]|uniref:Family 16 glycosylhydrolase n=1 Tax=Donghicola mangrovi TaxID=2729614 RepID=A0A850QFK7_9RHOB|nr:family 16 glycosylhydrolase [Donghicola mangrovi]NVO25750.1 family 16 glycosylhydrolase [Donghicola mangrovi]